MRCWGELKSLRGQSVGEVRLVMRAIFRICGNQSQPGLQIVEKLAIPLPRIPCQVMTVHQAARLTPTSSHI